MCAWDRFLVSLLGRWHRAPIFCTRQIDLRLLDRTLVTDGVSTDGFFPVLARLVSNIATSNVTYATLFGNAVRPAPLSRYSHAVFAFLGPALLVTDMALFRHVLVTCS